ncbi:MAG: hypothetical protein MUF10_19965, partial [Thermoanaerobaculaceae bacterium]|nr:hypothetical protein [Thermoanaerobaculaceae bacterium]
MIRRVLALALVAALLAVPAMLWTEPYYTTISATQTVQSKALPTWTQTVVLVSDGTSSSCYFRLFTDCETPANATTSNSQLKSGERLIYSFVNASSPSSTQPHGIRDLESYCPDGTRARYYKSLSVICAAGQTATWRV